MEVGLSLMKNVLQMLSNCLLIQLALTTAASAPDAGIHNKILGILNPGSGTTTLTKSKKEVDDVMEIVWSHKVSGLLLQRVTKITENETKGQKGRYLSTPSLWVLV